MTQANRKSAPSDPIFAAIARFDAAGVAYWTAHIAAEKRLGIRLWGAHPELVPVANFWQQAGAALACTPVTTLAGIEALADLIADYCERVESDIGEGGEALCLAGHLRDSIAAFRAQAESGASQDQRRAA